MLDPLLVFIIDVGQSKDVGDTLGVIPQATISREVGEFIDGDRIIFLAEVHGLVGCADVPKESGLTKNFDCGLIVQENV